MNKRIIFNFILITFLFSWACFVGAKFLPENIQMILVVIGIFGPVVSTFVTLKIHGEREYTARFKENILKWNVPVFWYLFPIIIVVITQIFDAAGQIVLGSFEINYSGIHKIYMVVPMILLMLIGGGQEEIGWRGFLLPELLKKLSPITSSLLVAIVWAVWHVPLFFY